MSAGAGVYGDLKTEHVYVSFSHIQLFPGFLKRSENPLIEALMCCHDSINYIVYIGLNVML